MRALLSLITQAPSHSGSIEPTLKSLSGTGTSESPTSEFILNTQEFVKPDFWLSSRTTPHTALMFTVVKENVASASLVDH